MALEIIPGTNTQLLALDNESDIRTTSRAVENFYGLQDNFTQQMRAHASNATKIGVGEDYKPTVILWDTEAEMAVKALVHMYDGFPRYERRNNGVVTSVEWFYPERRAAQHILGLRVAPLRQAEEAFDPKPELLPSAPSLPESDVIEQDRGTFTWVTGLLSKFNLARLINGNE
jgi:hypothetical protein